MDSFCFVKVPKLTEGLPEKFPSSQWAKETSCFLLSVLINGTLFFFRDPWREVSPGLDLGLTVVDVSMERTHAA